MTHLHRALARILIHPVKQFMFWHSSAFRVTKVLDRKSDCVADTWRGHLLERREHHNGAYLTRLDDQGGNLSGYGYDAFGRIKNHRWNSAYGELAACEGRVT